MENLSLQFMRVLRIVLLSLLAAAAVIGGVLVTAFVALAAVAALLTRKLLRGSRRHSTEPHPPAAPRARFDATEAIDVTATEVPAEPPRRLQ